MRRTFPSRGPGASGTRGRSDWRLMKGAVHRTADGKKRPTERCDACTIAAVMRATILVCLLLAIWGGAAGCGSGEPLSVTTIQLGRSLNPDNTVGTHTTRFKPDDTIYVAVLTDGSGAAKIGARWMYAGRVVSETTKDVSYKGAAATEFHIQNSGGFPAGEYKVEVLVNGQSIGTREFRVEK
jgi:hypothetical protein